MKSKRKRTNAVIAPSIEELLKRFADYYKKQKKTQKTKTVLQEHDCTKLRYAIYARKSSEDDNAQEKSLPNQVEECKRYAQRLNLNVVEVITEQKSAKMAFNRPSFAQLLIDLWDEKYDGIIAWHPDRLTRNSLESGMLIDMLDNGIIKDLKMPTTPFDNKASSKMMMNMLFAMAKQYSEHLSENISSAQSKAQGRGVSSGTPKWGYSRNPANGHYEPDENYDIIKKGWEMRINGSTLNEVLDYFKAHKVHRKTHISRRNKTIRPIYLTNKATVSTILRDPFYCGTLIQAGEEIPLKKHYDFKPMISEEEYNKVQSLSRVRLQTTPTVKGKVFLPLRGLVVCGSCHKPMTPGASGRKGEKKLYFECRNPKCEHRQTIRAKKILSALYEQLDKVQFSNKEYKAFLSKANDLIDERRQGLQKELKSLKGSESMLKNEFDKMSKGYAMAMSSGAPAETIKSLEKQLGQISDEKTSLGLKIAELEKKIKCAEDISRTEEDFLNIANSIGDKMRAGTPIQKDKLARLILLNIEIDNKKEPHFLWKEPFDTIIKRSFVQSGAPD